MHQRSCTKLFAAVRGSAWLACAIHLASCATTRVREIEVCLPDPRNGALQCTSKDGVKYTRPWDVSAEDYACFPLDQLPDYLKGCE
jgi:hypothetical protein